MSGEPKTLTPRAMTLEEFLAELGNERNASLARYKYADGTEQWAVNDSWSNQIAWAHTWPELATKALGVPVVARDEAALTYRGHPISVAEAQAILDVFPQVVDNAREIEAQILELRNSLRRLAGGENER